MLQFYELVTHPNSSCNPSEITRHLPHLITIISQAPADSQVACLTGDSQDLSKEEMMSVARFYPRKTRFTMAEAFAILPARVTAIRDLRNDRRTHLHLLGATALIRRIYILSRDLLATTPTLRRLSNHQRNRRTARQCISLDSAIPDHRIAGTSRRTLVADRPSDSSH